MSLRISTVKIRDTYSEIRGHFDIFSAFLQTLDHLQKSVGKQKKLGKNSFESVYKERYIADTSELISKCFDFCIETLGRGIG